MNPLDDKTQFDTFGFVIKRGLFSSDEMAQFSEWFIKGFERLRGGPYRDGDYDIVQPAIGLHEGFGDYFADPRIHDILALLLGEGYQALGSDAQQYRCGTPWHRDTIIPMQPADAEAFAMLKVAMYLDDLSEGQGSLWIIPGSHHPGAYYDALDAQLGHGCPGRERPPERVPGAIDTRTRPGDIIFFNQRAFHASFGGEAGRRIFSMTFSEKPIEDWHFAWFDHHAKMNAEELGRPLTGRIPAYITKHPSTAVQQSISLLIERLGEPEPDWTASMYHP